MVKHLLPKGGVHALAYPAHDASAPKLCLLKILHSDLQFAVSLEHSTIIDNQPQLITFRYEGGNLIPSRMSLGNDTIRVDVEMLSKVIRQGSPKLQVLSLTLRELCSVWYPKMAPKLSTDFPGLLSLARATEVCICFDTRWLGHVNEARLQGIVESSQELAGIPPNKQFTDLYQKAPWPLLSFILEAEPAVHLPTEDLESRAIPSIEDAEAREYPVRNVMPEDPPSYEEVPNKPASHSHPSPTSGTPWKCNRYPSYSPSPTEVATPTSLPSSTSTVKVDIFQDIVSSAVEKALPAVFCRLLREICARHSPSHSPLPTTSNPIPNAHAHYDQTASHCSASTAILNSICAHMVTKALDEALKKPFKKVLDEAFNKAFEEASQKAFDQSSEVYDSIVTRLDEHFSDSMLGLTAVQETHQFDLNEFCNQKVSEFKQRVEELEEKRDEVMLETWDKLDAVGKQALANANGNQSARRQSLRGTSSPL